MNEKKKTIEYKFFGNRRIRSKYCCTFSIECSFFVVRCCVTCWLIHNPYYSVLSHYLMDIYLFMCIVYSKASKEIETQCWIEIETHWNEMIIWYLGDLFSIYLLLYFSSSSSSPVVCPPPYIIIIFRCRQSIVSLWQLSGVFHATVLNFERMDFLYSCHSSLLIHCGFVSWCVNVFNDSIRVNACRDHGMFACALLIKMKYVSKQCSHDDD